MPTRNGSAQWKGDVPTGTGTVTVGNGVFSGNYSFKSRFEEGEGTNPEELIAASHAACFSMALSSVLSGAGHAPDSIETTAQVHLRFIDDAPTIAQIELATTGAVPGITQDEFAAHAATAKANCPVSRALAGVPDISVTATLA